MNAAFALLISTCIFIITPPYLEAINQTIPKSNSNSSQQPTNLMWNHLLVVSYAANFCLLSDCIGQPVPFEIFTIHGLWPQGPIPNYAISGPFDPNFENQNVDCHWDTLDQSDVAPLLNHLYPTWPSLSRYQVQGQPIGFWRSEYLRHGTCSWFEKYTYFRVTLALFWTLNPDLLLRILPPSNYVDYEAKDIHDAHELLQLPRPYVSCFSTPDGGDYLLSELFYCVDSSGYVPVDCTVYYTNLDNCFGRRFKILPATPSNVRSNSYALIIPPIFFPLLLMCGVILNFLISM